MTEERQTRSKKPLIALLVVAIVGIIGGTFAYFTSTDTFANVFQTSTYKTEVVETMDTVKEEPVEVVKEETPVKKEKKD